VDFFDAVTFLGTLSDKSDGNFCPTKIMFNEIKLASSGCFTGQK